MFVLRSPRQLLKGSDESSGMIASPFPSPMGEAAYDLGVEQAYLVNVAPSMAHDCTTRLSVHDRYSSLIGIKRPILALKGAY